MPHDLDWDGCFNVRDLGGFTTPRGTTAFRVFVRADNARKLSPRGWLAASEYGVRTVLDLRSDPECAADPPAHPDFNHRRLSLFDHFDGNASYRSDLLTRLASLDVSEKFGTFYREALELDAERFAEAIAVLAEAEGTAVFHCVGGKDRTGLLAALLLRLVGVPQDEVEADYVHSEGRLGRAPAPDREHRTPARVINRVVDQIEDQYGSIAGYLDAAGAPAEHVEEIRRKFVTRGRSG